jgi:hypothetical protein
MNIKYHIFDIVYSFETRFILQRSLIYTEHWAWKGVKSRKVDENLQHGT